MRCPVKPLLSPVGAVEGHKQVPDISENILNGKTCQEIHLLHNFTHSFNHSKHAQNKLLWVMTCIVKHSVYSSVVERLMITIRNNLLTRGRSENAASQAVSLGCRTSASQQENLWLNTNLFGFKTTTARRPQTTRQQKAATKQQQLDNRTFDSTKL